MNRRYLQTTRANTVVAAKDGEHGMAVAGGSVAATKDSTIAYGSQHGTY